ncbi:MAG: hypothetical protein OEU92_16975 [Alphaproteobacteria bacterium]|nr:hypothetical protein [Alphaproteobacteria bacterium]
MSVVIEEVTAEVMKPAAPERPNQPLTEMPADSGNELRKTLAAADRKQRRKDRLRAD